MKIGYVSSTGFPSLEANGVQVVQMCRAFAALGHEVTFLVPRSEDFGNDAAAMTAARELFGDDLSFRVEFVPRVRIFGRMEVLGSVAGTLRAIRRIRPDLVYTRNAWSVVFLPWAKIPYVFEAHDERAGAKSTVVERWLRRTIVRNARRPLCALVVTISEALRKIWEGHGVPREKLCAAHDGVELAMFDPGRDKMQAREELKTPLLSPEPPLNPPAKAGGDPSTRPMVVYTGALRADRGIDVILQAAGQLDGMDFYLVGGRDAEIRKAQAAVKASGLMNVHFPGRFPHKEIPLWLAAADILLMMWTWKVPTIRGCSPMKMFEYMAAGRIIVGPAFPTIQEVLEHGKDSILFEPDRLDALVAALREAVQRIGDPELPRAAREKVEREYTWQVRCRRILEALRKKG